MIDGLKELSVTKSLIDSMEQDYIHKCIYKCRALIEMIGKSTVLSNSINQ